MIIYNGISTSRNHQFNKTFVVTEFDTLNVDENRVELKYFQSNLIKIDYSNSEREDLKNDLKSIIRVFRFIKTMKRKLDNPEYFNSLNLTTDEAISVIKELPSKNIHLIDYGLSCLYFRFAYYHYRNILNTPNDIYLYINMNADSSIESMWKEKTKHNTTIPNICYNNFLFDFSNSIYRYIFDIRNLKSELDSIKLYYQIIKESNFLNYYDLVLYHKDTSKNLIPLGRSRDKERKLQMYRLLNYMSFYNIIHHRW